MSLFSVLGSWFNKQEASAKKVFTRIDGLLHKAEPIVAEIDAVLTAETKALGSPAVMTVIEKYLGKYITDEKVVESFVSANESAPVASMVHNAAALVTSLVGTGQTAKISSDIDTAVQVAYSILKQGK